MQVGTFTMAQMGQSKSVVGEFMKQKRKVCSYHASVVGRQRGYPCISKLASARHTAIFA